MKQKEDIIIDIAEDIQNECHKFVDQVQKEKPEITYQAAFDTYMFYKLAELQFQINVLTDKD